MHSRLVKTRQRSFASSQIHRRIVSGNLHYHFLKIYVVLCKHVLIRHRNRTLQSQSHCSNHSYQQLQTCNNLQISMNPVKSNSLICNCGSCFPVMVPKRVLPLCSSILRTKVSGPAQYFKICSRHNKTLRSPGSTCGHSPQNRTFSKRLPLRQSSCENQTKCQHPCYRISSTLVCKNFSGRNVLKHYNKLKQNSKRSYINQLLQQNEIFKPLQNQKTGTMQKQQNQIKYRMNRVFRSHHLKDAHLCPCSYQSERLTHYGHKFSFP